MKLKQNLVLTFLIISSFIGVLGVVTLYEINEIVKPLHEDIPKTFETLTLSSEMDMHALNIRYYDEILTQSARNFAFTGDPIWKDRYYETVVLLDDEISRAISSGDEIDASFFDNVEFANQKLIELETQSLFAAVNGDSESAIQILESDEYSNYKTIYSQGLNNYADRHNLSYEDAILSANLVVTDLSITTDEKVSFGTTVIILIVISVVAFSFVFGIVISTRVVLPIYQLNVAAKKISNGDLDVVLPESGFTETKELSSSFNKMSESLKKTIELEKKLSIAETQLKSERFAAIGEVSSKIAHDLKNPLTAIKAELEIIQHFNRANFDDKSKKRIRNMEDSIDMMYEQIEGMMNFVRATHLEITSTTVSNLMNSVAKITIKPDNVEINMPKNDFAIKCDVKKFTSVISNLITNSIQVLDKESGTVSISFKETLENIQIDVVDSGPGIPDDSLEKIFEPLYTTKYTGTGLGLSSCRNIVEQHGGTITAKNNPTTFTIILPNNPEKQIEKITQSS